MLLTDLSWTVVFWERMSSMTLYLCIFVNEKVICEISLDIRVLKRCTNTLVDPCSMACNLLSHCTSTAPDILYFFCFWVTAAVYCLGPIQMVSTRSLYIDYRLFLLRRLNWNRFKTQLVSTELPLQNLSEQPNHCV